jgi:hypothetical protein
MFIKYIRADNAHWIRREYHAAEHFSQLEVDDGNVWFGDFTSAVQLADTCVKLATCAVDLFSKVDYMAMHCTRHHSEVTIRWCRC